RCPLALSLVRTGGLPVPRLAPIAPAARSMTRGVLPLAIAGAMLLAEVWPRSPRPLRIVLGGGAAVALAAQLVLVMKVFETLDVVPYLGVSESAAQYLARTRHFANPFGCIPSSTPPDA